MSDSIVSMEAILGSIHVIREQRVLLDADLAVLYAVETKTLVRAVRPDDTSALKPTDDERLFGDVASLIEGARRRAAASVNHELVMLYWTIGKRVREEVLGGERAAYEEQVVERLAGRMKARYGRGWSRRNLFQMIQFASEYPDGEIVQTLSARLTWSHLVELLHVGDSVQRE